MAPVGPGMFLGDAPRDGRAQRRDRERPARLRSRETLGRPEREAHRTEAVEPGLPGEVEGARQRGRQRALEPGTQPDAVAGHEVGGGAAQIDPDGGGRGFGCYLAKGHAIEQQALARGQRRQVDHTPFHVIDALAREDRCRHGMEAGLAEGEARAGRGQCEQSASRTPAPPRHPDRQLPRRQAQRRRKPAAPGWRLARQVEEQDDAERGRRAATAASGPVRARALPPDPPGNRQPAKGRLASTGPNGPSLCCTAPLSVLDATSPLAHGRDHRSTMSVVVRFAPSPTGYLHIGGARTALFNWLFARHHGGRYLLRIEDTDRQRSTQAAIDAIFDGLGWLGLTPDEPPVFQFERAPRHAEVAHRLLAEGKAYRCCATPEELDAMRAAAARPRACRSATTAAGATATRARRPPGVRAGRPAAGAADRRDRHRRPGAGRGRGRQRAARRHGAAAGRRHADLHAVGGGRRHRHGRSRHVIRGDDHLTNAFRQMQLYRAMGAEPPRFAHIPLIHGPDGAKLSKRHGALSVTEYREMGFLPEAVRNYLLRLGWGHGDDEIISTEQAIAWFDLGARRPVARALRPGQALQPQRALAARAAGRGAGRAGARRSSRGLGLSAGRRAARGGLRRACRG